METHTHFTVSVMTGDTFARSLGSIAEPLFVGKSGDCPSLQIQTVSWHKANNLKNAYSVIAKFIEVENVNRVL